MINASISHQPRDVLFVSHATPEDNEFAKWITLRLAGEGYPVYCEILNLLGGEDPWKNVQKIIREKTVKFLFVASNVSMQEKTGARKELTLAEQVARKKNFEEFIIPLSIENLTRDEYCIELQTTYPVAFEQGWARGLNQLLEKLERQKITKNPAFNPGLVNSWWRNNFDANKGLENKPEELLSNWFEIDKIPDKLYYHYLKPGYTLKFPPDTKGYYYPYKPYGKGIVSFSGNAEDFPDGDFLFGDKFPFKVESLLENNHSNVFLSDRETRDTITDLLRQAWENLFIERGLQTYTLANKSRFCYFKKGQLEKDKIHFIGVDDNKTWRSVIGFKTAGQAKRYWHFGVAAKPLFWGKIFFSVSPHVLFSSDGENMWNDAGKLHKAKMNQCRNWWNPQWRDRIRAVMNFLADGKEAIPLTLGSAENLVANLNNFPVKFLSPMSLIEEKKIGKGNAEEMDDLEDDFIEGEKSDYDFEDDAEEDEF